jgi:hypothetical protein
VSRRTGATTPEGLLLHTWNLVHRARNFPAVQAPLMTALQEIAKALRPAETNLPETREPADAGPRPTGNLLAA